jgi:hypothetical protein
MSAHDYSDFLVRLRQDFPSESFLLLRFGDHQPAISIKALDPDADAATIAGRVMTYDPRYFTTYYAIDIVNFSPVDLSSPQPARRAVSAACRAGGRLDCRLMHPLPNRRRFSGAAVGRSTATTERRRAASTGFCSMPGWSRGYSRDHSRTIREHMAASA